MNLTAVRPEMLSKDLSMTEFWYKRARQTDDRYLQELYTNRALYGSLQVAKQETAKYFQKEMHSGTMLVDSAEIFVSESSNADSQDTPDGDEGTKRALGAGASVDGSNFVTHYIDATRATEIFEMVTSIIDTPIDKSIVAMFVWDAGLFNWFSPEQNAFFATEFELLEEATHKNSGRTKKYQYQKLAKIPQNRFTEAEREIKSLLALVFA